MPNEDVRLLNECLSWINNPHRALLMRKKDPKTFDHFRLMMRDACECYENVTMFTNQDHERISMLLKSCYWLFKMANKPYPPLADWYHNPER